MHDQVHEPAARCWAWRGGKGGWDEWLTDTSCLGYVPFGSVLWRNLEIHLAAPMCRAPLTATAGPTACTALPILATRECAVELATDAFQWQAACSCISAACSS